MSINILMDKEDTIYTHSTSNLNFDNHIDLHGFKFDKNELYFHQHWYI